MEGIKNLLAHKQDKIVKQTPVECFANLDGELDKVLAINANAQTNSAEFFDKECKFGGDVLISVTYRTEDDQINTVTTNCNFADTINMPKRIGIINPLFTTIVSSGAVEEFVHTRISII